VIELDQQGDESGPRPLRVVHVLSGDLWAGAEVMSHQLLKGLNAHPSCNVLAVVLNEGPVASKLRQDNVQVCVLDETRNSFAQLLAGLRRVVREFRPSLVHSHRYKENILTYLATRGNSKVSIVATQHGLPEESGKKAGLKTRLVRGMNSLILSRCFDQWVAVSRDMRHALEDNGIDTRRLQVIHNGIELPPCSNRPRPANGLAIGSCGRLFPVKNFGLFLETAARVVQRAADIHFELAGDGPQMESLRRQCSRHALDGKVILHGHRDDISDFYDGLDVYMSTSIHEGIPMSVLEAMGHGLPVVAPEVGGFPEIVDHGVDGLLIPEHDPDLFAQACLTIRDNPDVLRQMSTSARQKVESAFSVQSMTSNYYGLYQDLVFS
jgi:glycosyltransferase involved in cell wall biosynthesis